MTLLNGDTQRRVAFRIALLGMHFDIEQPPNVLLFVKNYCVDEGAAAWLDSFSGEFAEAGFFRGVTGAYD